MRSLQERVKEAEAECRDWPLWKVLAAEKVFKNPDSKEAAAWWRAARSE